MGGQEHPQNETENRDNNSERSPSGASTEHDKKSCTSQNQKIRCDHVNDAPQLLRIPVDRWIELGFTAAILVATVVNVCVARLQWSTMQESNGINRDAYNAQSRAFVVSQGLSWKYSFAPDLKRNVWAISPRWENTGNTPTREFHHFVNWRPRNVVMPSGFTFPDLASTGALTTTDLGPHQSKPGAVYRIGPEIMEFVKKRAAMFYFYGWGTYRDMLDPKKEHRTEFCRVIYDFEGDTNSADGHPVDEECPHNCEDEECAKLPAPNPNDAGLCGVTFIVMAKPSEGISQPSAPALNALPQLSPKK